MGIAGADVDALMALHALEARPDVILRVFDEMSEVQRRVRVRQRARDEDVSLRFHGLLIPVTDRQDATNTAASRPRRDYATGEGQMLLRTSL